MIATAARPTRLETLLPRLACPSCRGALRAEGGDLECAECSARYPVVAGRPVFLPAGSPPAKVMPEGHLSNQPPDALLDQIEGLILNIGAGGTAHRRESCIELEYSVFRHTDVVSDAHDLPFADETFDAVVTFNTFEHLADPPRAASEIFRVLKPGGRLLLHTAFLQPLHEPPHHYYNTTEFGLRRWFHQFDVEAVTVSDNFHPAHVLAWLASQMLWAVEATAGPSASQRLSETTLGSWKARWEDPSVREDASWDTLRRLPQELQKRFSAGFQLDAIKPLPGSGRAAS